MKKLIPLNVPWSVSPSSPNIKIICEEDGDTLVQFFAFFGFIPHTGKEITREQVIVGTDGLTIDPTLKHGRYHLISLTFKNVGWVLRNIQHSDIEVIDESQYDWSEVRGAIRSGEDISTWKQRYAKEWKDTEISPDPAIYVVTNSDWHSDEAEKWNLNHYLIVGYSSSVEILAQDMEWASEGVVLDW